MSYILKGKLRGRVSSDVSEPLSDATVMFYRIRDDNDGAAAAGNGNQGAGGMLVSDEEVTDKRYALIAQTRTNADGEFEVDLATKTIYGYQGSTHTYAGEPLEVDVCCRAVPNQKTAADCGVVQAFVARVDPDWQESGNGRVAHWEHEIPEHVWHDIRKAFDAWVISGRVVRRGSGDPVSGAKVHAYDADLRQDDFLGTAVTDEGGRFRIDYTSSDFRKTSVRGADFEIGGPDIYFRIESEDGKVLLSEGKERGDDPDRANVGNCVSVELQVDDAAVASA